MKRIILICSLFCTTLSFAQDMPDVPGIPDLQWGMSYEDAQQYLPGDYRGHIIAQRQTWTEFPDNSILGQYYFAENTLRYVQFIPRYSYENLQDWQPEYQFIEEYVTDIYGDPEDHTDKIIIWESPTTQSRLSMTPNGWVVRFDRRR